MGLFLLFFISIYGSGHLYFYRKLTRAFLLSRNRRLLLGIILVLSTLAPILVRFAERHGSSTLATSLAYPGYLWMATLFLFLVMSASWDAFSALNHLLMVVRRQPRRPTPLMFRRQFKVCSCLAIICSGYGIYEAQDIHTERIVIATPKLPRHERLRIVQISDLHLGILLEEARLGKIIRAVGAAKPDILVSTGDLIDGILTHDGVMSRQFLQIKPRLGAFAVPGNHEYHVGYQRALSMTKEAGFTMLKGEYAAIGPILIAGADDPAARRSDSFQPLPTRKQDSFTLLLKHQPRISAEIPFDLQLSGHVHKGQIFPFNIITWLSFRINCGLTKLADGRQIYVSRGTGTWGPPIRFLAPPEITVIDLVASEK